MPPLAIPCPVASCHLPPRGAGRWRRDSSLQASDAWSWVQLHVSGPSGGRGVGGIGGRVGGPADGCGSCTCARCEVAASAIFTSTAHALSGPSSAGKVRPLNSLIWAVMAAHPENIEEWCYLVPHLLSQAGWQSIAEGQAVSFSHCKCPWGGSLVKLAVLRVKVTDPPEDPAHILVRPESRAWGASKFSETSPEYFAVQKQFVPWGKVLSKVSGGRGSEREREREIRCREFCFSFVSTTWSQSSSPRSQSLHSKLQTKTRHQEMQWCTGGHHSKSCASSRCCWATSARSLCRTISMILRRPWSCACAPGATTRKLATAPSPSHVRGSTCFVSF